MHSRVLTLAIEPAPRLGISAGALYLLHRVRQALERDIRQGKSRARFSSNVIRLMLPISPVPLVLLYSHSLAAEIASFGLPRRDAPLPVLPGQFVGLRYFRGILLPFGSRHSRRQAPSLSSQLPGGGQ